MFVAHIHPDETVHFYICLPRMRSRRTVDVCRLLQRHALTAKPQVVHSFSADGVQLLYMAQGGHVFCMGSAGDAETFVDLTTQRLFHRLIAHVRKHGGRAPPADVGEWRYDPGADAGNDVVSMAAPGGAAEALRLLRGLSLSGGSAGARVGPDRSSARAFAAAAKEEARAELEELRVRVEAEEERKRALEAEERRREAEAAARERERERERERAAAEAEAAATPPPADAFGSPSPFAAPRETPPAFGTPVPGGTPGAFDAFGPFGTPGASSTPGTFDAFGSAGGTPGAFDAFGSFGTPGASSTPGTFDAFGTPAPRSTPRASSTPGTFDAFATPAAAAGTPPAPPTLGGALSPAVGTAIAMPAALSPSVGVRRPAALGLCALTETLSCAHEGGRCTRLSLEGTLSVGVQRAEHREVLLLSLSDPKSQIQTPMNLNRRTAQPSGPLSLRFAAPPPSRPPTFLPLLKYRLRTGGGEGALRPVPLKVKRAVLRDGAAGARVRVQVLVNPSLGYSIDLQEVSIGVRGSAAVAEASADGGGAFDGADRVSWKQDSAIGRLAPGKGAVFTASVRYEGGGVGVGGGVGGPGGRLGAVEVKAVAMEHKFSAVAVRMSRRAEGGEEGVPVRVKSRLRIVHRVLPEGS